MYRYDENGDERDPVDVVSDATKDATASAAAESCCQLADDLLYVAYAAVERLGKQHPKCREALLDEVVRHLHEFKSLAESWGEDALQARRGRVRQNDRQRLE